MHNDIYSVIETAERRSLFDINLITDLCKLHKSVECGDLRCGCRTRTCEELKPRIGTDLISYFGAAMNSVSVLDNGIRILGAKLAFLYPRGNFIYVHGDWTRMKVALLVPELVFYRQRGNVFRIKLVLCASRQFFLSHVSVTRRVARVVARQATN